VTPLPNGERPSGRRPFVEEHKPPPQRQGAPGGGGAMF
jgi:hypothetical protein